MIEFDGEFEMDLPPEELWDYFTDPEILAEAGPGVKEMNVVSPHEIEAVLSVSVGSVSPTFNVDVTVVEAEFPNRLKMVAVGNATRNAFETTATMDLQENGDGGTNATWTAAAEVSGLLASLGQRALGGVTKRLVSNFFEDIEDMAEEGREATSQLESVPEEEVELEELDEEVVEGEGGG